VKIAYEKISQTIKKGDCDCIDEKLSIQKNFSSNLDDQYKEKENINIVDVKRKRQIVSNLLCDKYDDYIESSNNLSDLLVFSSNEFLKNKLNLTNDEINKLKVKGDPFNEINELFDNDFLNSFDSKVENIQKSEKPIEKASVVEVIKKEAEIVRQTLSNKKADPIDDKIKKTSIERNIEEDLHSEVFHIMKGINRHARNFTTILESDNQVRHS
jgi:ATP-dependent 26S proteasome regulatory subunit